MNGIDLIEHIAIKLQERNEPYNHSNIINYLRHMTNNDLRNLVLLWGN